MGFHFIGKSVSRVDGWEKVTGKAVYGSDIFLPGMLYAKGVYAKHKHARILAVHKEKAEKMPGVVYIATARDVPGEKMIGEACQDQYVIADDKVRYLGDVVAVVAAETYEQAVDAANAVEVDYEVLPAVTSPAEAIDNEIVVTERFPDNVCAKYRACNGDTEQGFAESDVILERSYHTGFQEHAYLEPDVVIGIPSERKGYVTVTGGIHNIYMTRKSVCQFMAMPMSKVTIRESCMGGSFGGKQENTAALACRAALLAVITGRPVKYMQSREDCIRESFKRHPFFMDVKVGATKDGIIRAMAGNYVADAGAYVNKSSGIIGKAVTLGAGPYAIPNVDIFARAVITNNVHTGSQQGFGNPQGTFARECMLNELAEKLGMSPYRIRKKNIMKNGDMLGTGQVMDFHRVGADDVLETLERELDFERKYWDYKRENETRTDGKRKGVGISLSIRGNSVGACLPDVSRAYVEVEEDGSVLLSIGLTELGQGILTTMSQIAADALGVPLEKVAIANPDTSRGPLTGTTNASRGTLMGGAAIRDAAEKIHAIIGSVLQQEYGIDSKTLRFEEGQIFYEGGTMPFAEAVQLVYDRGQSPIAVGNYQMPHQVFDPETGRGDPFWEYTYSGCGVELEADLCTGEVTVIKSTAAHDIGRAINPLQANGQIIQGMVSGLGYGLMERLNVVNGVIKHVNLDEYQIPTVMDIGEVIPYIIENTGNRTAYGARSLGEPALDPCAAAYVGAVNHALNGCAVLRTTAVSLEDIILNSNFE